MTEEAPIETKPEMTPTESLREKIRSGSLRRLRSADDLRCDGIWESMEEVYEFIAQVREWRRSGT